MNNEIAVSVICNAYNHEKYIRSALEGFVRQKTSFNFEVLIHDDASTDKTADIIREYEQKYPNIIKAIYQTENQYSKGVKVTKMFQFPRVKGRYVAVCEGDDYWTDEFKLQKQVDALDKHPEIDICAHEVKVVQNEKFLKYCTNCKKETIFTTDKVISGGGGFVGTASLMYRSELLKIEPEFRKVKSFDFSLQIYGALRGGMLFLPDRMAVYRFKTGNSWSESIEKNIKKLDAWVLSVNDMLKQLDIDTEFKYHKTICNKLNINNLALIKKHIKLHGKDALKDPDIKDIFKHLPSKFKIKIKIILLWRSIRK